MTKTLLCGFGGKSGKGWPSQIYRFIAGAGRSIPATMLIPPPGAIAVIFLSGRTAADADGYDAASQTMAEAASRRDGYLGVDAARDTEGFGITVSWWRDEAAAIGWRDDPDHLRIQEMGRGRWYDWYRVIVTTVDRAYGWARPTGD